MNTADILRKAKEHISDPAMWYQGGFTANHKYTDCIPADDEPCCGIGAVRWADKDRYSSKWWPLSDAAGRFFVDFNDDPNTTHADVMAAFDRAIEMVEAKS